MFTMKQSAIPKTESRQAQSGKKFRRIMPAPYAALGKTCLQRNKINLHKTFPAFVMPGTFLILSALLVPSVDTACCANMRVPASVSCVPATTVE